MSDDVILEHHCEGTQLSLIAMKSYESPSKLLLWSVGSVLERFLELKAGEVKGAAGDKIPLT